MDARAEVFNKSLPADPPCRAGATPALCLCGFSAGPKHKASPEHAPSRSGEQNRKAIRQLAEAATAISAHRRLSREERCLRAEMMAFARSDTDPSEATVDIAFRLDLMRGETMFPAAWTLVAACGDWLSEPRNVQLTYLMHMAAYRVIDVLGGQTS